MVTKRMTAKQFFGELAKSGLEWKLCYDNDSIRTRKPTFCPIVALARQGGFRGLSPANYEEAGASLGLSRVVSIGIADAADGICNAYRPQLLKVCGLKEKERR